MKRATILIALLLATTALAAPPKPPRNAPWVKRGSVVHIGDKRTTIVRVWRSPFSSLLIQVKGDKETLYLTNQMKPCDGCCK